MPRLSWSQSARDDLRSIDAWLTANASPELALRQLLAIREKALALEEFPAIGPIVSETLHSLQATGTPYRIVYEIRAGRIEVVRICHNRENWRP